jgi:prepilin-type N-terminal cleavage/methylation domain-containing protein
MRRKGFTLIEVLITLVLLSISSAVLVSAHTSLIRADQDSSLRLKVTMEIQSIQAKSLNGVQVTNATATLPGNWSVQVLPVDDHHLFKEGQEVSITPYGHRHELSRIELPVRSAQAPNP